MDDAGALAALLESASPQDRARAAEKLAQMGDQATEAGVQLVAAMADEDEAVREWAAEALENLGSPRAGDVPRLRDMVDSPSEDAAYWAITLLGRAGRDASNAEETLAAALERASSAAVRQRAAWALGKLGPLSAGVRAAVERAAAGSDARLARLAREALEASK